MSRIAMLSAVGVAFVLAIPANAGVAVVWDVPLDPYTALAALHGQQKAQELAQKGEYTVIAVHKYDDGGAQVVVTSNPDELGIYLPSANVKTGDKVKLVVDVRPYGVKRDASQMWDLAKAETWLRIYEDGFLDMKSYPVPTALKDGDTVHAVYKFEADDSISIYGVRFYAELPDLSEQETAGGVKATSFTFRERP